MTNAPKIIVIAEDEALIRMLAADTFAEAGFSVVEVQTAAEAIAELQERSGSVEVLFTDIHMPGGVTGLELARLVRQQWPDVVVAVTSGEDRPSSSDMLSGALFITKPYRADHVLARIRALVGD